MHEDYTDQIEDMIDALESDLPDNALRGKALKTLRSGLSMAAKCDELGDAPEGEAVSQDVDDPPHNDSGEGPAEPAPEPITQDDVDVASEPDDTDARPEGE